MYLSPIFSDRYRCDDIREEEDIAAKTRQLWEESGQIRKMYPLP